jgi:hypothetical protein
MKKLIITIAVSCLLSYSFGQTTRSWIDTLVVTHSLDTVLFPNETGDISSYPYTIQFQVLNLGSTDTVQLGFGGGNIVTSVDDNGKPLTTSFTNQSGFSTSLPFYLRPSESMIITNTDTIYASVPFRGSKPFGVKRPGYYVNTHADTTFTLITTMIFSK